MDGRKPPNGPPQATITQTLRHSVACSSVTAAAVMRSAPGSQASQSKASPASTLASTAENELRSPRLIAAWISARTCGQTSQARAGSPQSVGVDRTGEVFDAVEGVAFGVAARSTKAKHGEHARG